MIALTIIFLISCPWIFGFIQKGINKKINGAIMLSMCFAFFYFFLSPIIISYSSITYQTYSIIFWVVFCLLLISILGFFLWLILYKKIKYIEFLNEEWLKSSIISSSILLTSIMLLFVRVNFTDTTAYINLSSNFAYNNLLSFDGINTIGLAYKIPPIYYTNAVFFKNEINASYQYLNPIIFFTFISYSFNEMNFLIFKKEKDKYFISINILANALFSCLFMVTSYFSTSGNLFIQTSIIFFFLFNLYNSRNVFISICSILMLPFFSSTGFLNLILITICSMIYIILFENIKKIIPILLGSIIIFSPFLTALLKNNIGYILYWIIVLIAMIGLIFNKKITKKIPSDIILIKEKLIINKIFNYLYLAFSLLISLTIVVYFGHVYPHRENYPSFTVYLFFILSSLISFINFFEIKKTNFNKEQLIFPIMWLSTLISTLFFFIVGLGNNLSLWRVIYMNIGMGGIIDIILLIYLLVLYNIDLLKIKFKIKTIIIKKISLSLSSFLLFLSSIGFGVFLNEIKPEKLFFDSNVEKNLYGLSKQDINYLNSLNTSQNKIKVVSDGPFLQYIKNYQCVSDLFFKTKIFNNNSRLQSLTTSWYVSSYNFEGSIDFYNLNAIDKINTSSSYLINYFQEFVLQYTTNSKEVDFIILDKSTSYFLEFEKWINTNINNESVNMYLNYDGINISIWGINGKV